MICISNIRFQSSLFFVEMNSHNNVSANDLTSNNPGEEYWQSIAEQRIDSLYNAHIENVELYYDITSIEEDLYLRHLVS